jgi:exonuclease SbcC
MPSKVNRTYSPEAFSFYDETYGSDARKIFISTMNGVRHKSVIAIDAVKRKQKSYLYEEVNGVWKPLNPDGTAESFDAAVEKTFGTPELYFISNFRDQKAKSFSRYSKGDIKEILAELLGINGLKALSEKASRIRKKLQEHCAYLTKEKDDLSRVITGKEEKASQARKTLTFLSETTARIQALEQDRNENQQSLHSVVTKVALQEEKERVRQKALADIAAKQHELDELTKNSQAGLEAFRAKAAALLEKIAGKKSLLAKMDALKEKACELGRLQEKISNLKNSVKRCDERYVALIARIATLQATEKLVKDKERELEKIRLSRKHTIETMQSGIAELKAKVRRLSEYRCNATDASSCPFVADARDAKQAIPEKEIELKRLSESPEPKEATIVRELGELRTTCSAMPLLRQEADQLLSTKKAVEEELRLSEEHGKTLTDDLRPLAEAEQAERELPDREKELASLEAEKKDYVLSTANNLATLNENIRKRQEEVFLIVTEPGLAEAKERLLEVISGLSREIDAKRMEEARLSKEAGALEEALRQIVQAEDRWRELDHEITYLTSEVAEWIIEEKATGNDGIIALEIDDAGPTIASLANELLRVYDAPFSVKINTQEMARDGKLKEGFDIPVFDAHTNRSKSLKKLSGGEGTIVEDAVAKAICIYNKQKHGKDLATIFTDERDGALDHERKRAYFRMKQKVLTLGGYSQEYCITHTPELLAMANAVISLGPGGITITTNT